MCKSGTNIQEVGDNLFGERVASACFTQKYYQDLTSFIARAVMNPKSQIWWTSSQKKNTNFCPT